MMEFDLLSNRVIGCCLEVHRTLGPGLLESAYATCLAIELAKAGISFEKEKRIDIDYKGHLVECAYRADFVIENTILLELKSVESLTDIHVS
jgi:GxxExxY protein